VDYWVFPDQEWTPGRPPVGLQLDSYSFRVGKKKKEREGSNSHLKALSEKSRDVNTLPTAPEDEQNILAKCNLSMPPRSIQGA
jgi:hypothetical protein